MTGLEDLAYQLLFHSLHIFNQHVHTPHTHKGEYSSAHLACVSVAPVCVSVSVLILLYCSIVCAHWPTIYMASEATVKVRKSA